MGWMGWYSSVKMDWISIKIRNGLGHSMVGVLSPEEKKKKLMLNSLSKELNSYLKTEKLIPTGQLVTNENTDFESGCLAKLIMIDRAKHPP
ncbi:hypothetical protein CTI12_AA122900 [Artemisia annua]|uniref:Uncharacterized protein n=1 Tax=Artemisia annua TaxID=35608 RepID=A0A2U1PR71_ARTAN|nr:hypothetical protein CTI12_AA122900 [Artemisia annua]